MVAGRQGVGVIWAEHRFNVGAGGLEDRTSAGDLSDTVWRFGGPSAKSAEPGGRRLSRMAA